MLFTVLARKTYLRNLQYRSSHALNTVASAVFGFIAVAIWQGIGADHSLGSYGVRGMVDYVAFNQACLWLTVFMTQGLGIPGTVRSGQVALDMMRPAHLFYMTMSREWGQLLYQLLYKVVPIYLFYLLVFDLRLPRDPLTIVETVVSLGGAAYIGISLQYLIGITSFWTTESHWLAWLNFSIFSVLAGYLIPLEWLPDWLQTISRHSFYPYLQYYPTRLYMGLENGSVLTGLALWCIFLTTVCLAATALVRRKLEVQGG